MIKNQWQMQSGCREGSVTMRMRQWMLQCWRGGKKGAGERKHRWRVAKGDGQVGRGDALASLGLVPWPDRRGW